eukprot:m.93787 g.93787  ORF g.93787 m.93787 type:complete len:64 (+) comp12399_c0_seq1:546-737(+)
MGSHIGEGHCRRLLSILLPTKQRYNNYSNEFILAKQMQICYEKTTTASKLLKTSDRQSNLKLQ